MLDSHYHPLARTNTEFLVCQITFYAIFLGHLPLGYGFCLGLSFVELTLVQEHSIDVFLRCVACLGV